MGKFGEPNCYCQILMNNHKKEVLKNKYIWKSEKKSECVAIGTLQMKFLIGL